MYVAKSFGMNAIAQILDAACKFLILPILLLFFGEASYGLLTTVLSVNLYLLILDLGMNTGATKFYSEWLLIRDIARLRALLRVSLIFYLVVSLINSLVLLSLGYFSDYIFQNKSQVEVDAVQALLYMSSLFPIFNWMVQIANQILTAQKKVYIIGYFSIFRSMLYVLVVLVTVSLELELEKYFFLFLSSIALGNLVQMSFVYRRNADFFAFGKIFDLNILGEVLRYSGGILLMGFMLATITKTAPFIISLASPNGFADVALYKIPEIVVALVVALGGILTNIFLPEMLEKQKARESDVSAFESYFLQKVEVSCLVAVCLCMPIALCASEIIELFVGAEYKELHGWLALWSIILMFNFYNAPGASLLLSIGEFVFFNKALSYSFIITPILSILLVSNIGFGGAVIAYGLHTLYVCLLYFFRIYKQHFSLSPLKIARVLLRFYFPAFCIALALYLINGLFVASSLIFIFSKVFFFFALYIGFHMSILKTDIRRLVNQ